MKLRTVTLFGLVAGATCATVWWRRRRRAAAAPAVQLGLTDGSTTSLAAGDPSGAEIHAAAAVLRGALQG